MAMTKYRLLGSQHRTKDGKTYEKGEIVESDRRLDEIFVGVFEKLSEIVAVDIQSDSLKSGEDTPSSPPFKRDVKGQFPFAF